MSLGFEQDGLRFALRSDDGRIGLPLSGLADLFGFLLLLLDHELGL